MGIPTESKCQVGHLGPLIRDLAKINSDFAMFIPPGFSQKSVQTSLGTIVYYTNDLAPWTDIKSKAQPTLVFLHCFDLTQYITQLKIPTALIWGQESKYTGPKVGQRLQEMNPQAIRIMYQLNDVGFTPQLELPAVTIGLICQFLPQLETTTINI